MAGEFIAFRFDGSRAVPMALAKAGESTREKARQIMGEGVQELVGRAKQQLSDDGHIVTGTLRRSIQGDAEYETYTRLHGWLGTDVEYAPYVEALPDGGYLFRTLILHGPKVYKDINDAIARLLRRIQE